MMAEKRAKEDIRLSIGKGNLPVICAYPSRIVAYPSLFRYCYTMRIVVDARDPYRYPMSDAPPAQHPEIIAAATSYLADAHLPPVPDQSLQPVNTDCMPAQPGIDHIQFPHVLFDIRKRDIVPVQQFLLPAPL
jgi:hypothetical protein